MFYEMQGQIFMAGLCSCTILFAMNDYQDKDAKQQGNKQIRKVSVCICVCMCVYACIYVHYVRLCLHARMYVCVWICIYVCMYVCMHMYIYLYTCVHTYVYLYVYSKLLLQACFTRNLCLPGSVTSCKCLSENPHSQPSPLFERRQFHVNGGIEVGDESV
jgi:hypothetical protein